MSVFTLKNGFAWFYSTVAERIQATCACPLRTGKYGFAANDVLDKGYRRHKLAREKRDCCMNTNNRKSNPACSRCGSDKIVMKARTSVGDTRADDVIRTEMIGCAVIYRYLACEACGQHVTRAEYEGFQEGRRHRSPAS